MVRDVQPVPGTIWSPLAGEVPPRMQGTVVHVGAYLGEELETYLASGFQKIILIEANPWSFRRLAVHVEFWRQWLATLSEVYQLEDPPLIQTINVAASDESNVVPLMIPDLPLQSSLLPPASMLIRPAAIVSILAKPLDMILNEIRIDHSEVRLLVVDAQGSEHKVLAGARSILKHAKCVIVELQLAERYKGQATAKQIDSILSQHGLFRKTSRNSVLLEDAVYLKQ
jgi:FkbM family methyltransferase